MELLTYGQDAVVHVNNFRDFPQPNAELAFIKTDYNDLIREHINKYIEASAKYHPITNNCVDFITDTANEADDVDLENYTVPNDFFDELLKQLGGRAKPPK